MIHFFHYLLWRYISQAGIVATHTRLVAIDTARAAWQVVLYGIVDGLVPTHETRKGMSGSPNADNWSVDK